MYTVAPFRFSELSTYKECTGSSELADLSGPLKLLLLHLGVVIITIPRKKHSETFPAGCCCAAESLVCGGGEMEKHLMLSAMVLFMQLIIIWNYLGISTITKKDV
jgi:hypothetical protein